MIISEDHILQEELNKLTRILLAYTNNLHLIIKDIKQTLIYTRKTNILPITPPFSDIGKSCTTTMRIGTQLSMAPCLPLSVHLNLYLPMQSQTFPTILSTPRKHIAHYNTIPNKATPILLHTPTQVNSPTAAALLLSLPPY